MTHVTCRLTAKNRDQLQNPTLCNRVRATFTFTFTAQQNCSSNDDLRTHARIGYTDISTGKQPAKLAPSSGGVPDSQPTRGCLGPPEFTAHTTSRSVQPFSQGSPLCPTDTQTDRPRYSVHAMRPNNNSTVQPRPKVCTCTCSPYPTLQIAVAIANISVPGLVP